MALDTWKMEVSGFGVLSKLVCHAKLDYIVL